ncbi:MAG: hypothetical protein P8179_01120 [Candidatus Thiodiazotropha sp.]
MKQSIKAALFSGLVFPGVGHFYLKHYLLGVIFASASLVATAFLLTPIIQVAQEIANKIATGEIPLDAGTINSQITQQVNNIASSASIALWSLISIWLIAIGDSYRLGRKRDLSSF